MILCPHNGTNLFKIARLTVDNLLISLHCQSICPSQYLRNAWMAKWIKNKETFFRYHSSEPVRYSVHQRFRSRFLWHKKQKVTQTNQRKRTKMISGCKIKPTILEHKLERRRRKKENSNYFKSHSVFQEMYLESHLKYSGITKS